MCFVFQQPDPIFHTYPAVPPFLPLPYSQNWDGPWENIKKVHALSYILRRLSGFLGPRGPHGIPSLVR